MRTTRTFAMVISLVMVLAASAAEARSVGQVIDDATVVAEIKAKLTADKISNLTQVGVKADSGIVTLSGTVDSEERRTRAAQIASGVHGVKGIVNTIQVKTAGTTAPAPTAAAPSPQPTVEVTGSVAQVNPTSKMVKLQDGRILRLTDRTLAWQPTTPTALKPGDQVILRDVEFVGYEPTVQTPQSAGWRMGTVRLADPATNQITLSDGTVLRITSSTVVRRGNDRVALEQFTPGSEVVFREVGPAPGISGSGDPSAFPRSDRTMPFVEVSEVRLISTPAPWRR
jgi:hypothetical protein